MNIRPHVFTVLAYLFCVVGIVIFLILLRPPIDPPIAEQPQRESEVIVAPATPPPAVNENKNKNKARRVRRRQQKPQAHVYRADDNAGIN